jgi:hypothetical protein
VGHSRKYNGGSCIKTNNVTRFVAFVEIDATSLPHFRMYVTLGVSLARAGRWQPKKSREVPFTKQLPLSFDKRVFCSFKNSIFFCKVR